MKFTDTRCVLVVDDDPQMSQLMCAVLTPLGCTPVACHTLAAGIQALEVWRCNTVLLDLVLPDSQANDTIYAIAAFRQAGARCVVVVTGLEVTNEIRDFAIQMGASEVISKDSRTFFKDIARVVSG